MRLVSPSLAAILLGITLVGSAQAAQRTVRWTPSVSDVAGHRIYHKLCAATTPPTMIQVVGPQVNNRVIELAIGNHCLYMTAYTSDGQESVPTPTLQHQVLAPPEPPTGVEITLSSAPAFTFDSQNRKSPNVAGFVPVGTACSGSIIFSYRGDPYRRVSANDVTWWNTAQQWRVAAPCRSGEVVAVV